MIKSGTRVHSGNETAGASALAAHDDPSVPAAIVATFFDSAAVLLATFFDSAERGPAWVRICFEVEFSDLDYLNRICTAASSIFLHSAPTSRPDEKMSKFLLRIKAQRSDDHAEKLSMILLALPFGPQHGYMIV